MIISLHHDSVKWIKRSQIHIGMVAFKNFSSCTFLLQGTVLLFSRFFVEDPKYLCFNGAKNFHKVTSLGELNATEIQQNIIEMFFCTRLLRLVLRPIVFSS